MAQYPPLRIQAHSCTTALANAIVLMLIIHQSGIGSSSFAFLRRGLVEVNTGYQAWQQALLPTESSYCHAHLILRCVFYTVSRVLMSTALYWKRSRKVNWSRYSRAAVILSPLLCCWVLALYSLPNLFVQVPFYFTHFKNMLQLLIHTSLNSFMCIWETMICL